LDPGSRRRLLLRGVYLSVGLLPLLYCITGCIYVSAKPYTGLYMLTGRRVSKVEGPAAEIKVLSGNPHERIEPGDKIESLDGRRPTDSTDLLKLTRTLQKGQTIEIAFKKPDGAIHKAQIVVRDAPIPVLMLLWTCVSAGLITAAYIMYLRRPEDPPARLYYLECVVAAVTFIGALSWQVIYGNWLLFSIFLLCSALIVPLGLHFFLVYPETSSALKRWPRLTVLPYIPMVVFLVVAIAVIARMSGAIPPSSLVPITESRYVDVLGGLALFYIPLAVLYLGLSVVNVYLTYKRTTQSEARTQIKWVLWGAAVSVMLLALLIVLAAENAQYHEYIFGRMQFMLLLIVLAMLISSGLSMLKYRLMYVDALLNRSLAYVLVSAVVFGAFSLTALVLTWMVKLITGTQSAITLVIAALAIIYVFRPISEWVQSWVDRLFYREKYEFQQAVWNVSSAIVSILDLDVVLRRVLDTVIDSLRLKRGAVLLWDAEHQTARVAYQRDFPNPERLLPPDTDDPLLRTILADPKPLVLRELIQDVSGNPDVAALQQRMVEMYVEAAVPICRGTSLLGILLLGRKRSRQIFTTEDLRLLQTLANQAAVAVSNAQTYSTINELNRSLATQIKKVDEQRREILALQEQLLRENIYLKEEIEQRYNFQDIVGASTGLRNILDTVKKVAPGNSACLVCGESGTGKELVARAIHFNTPRHNKPFVKVNCAALPETLLESELFGHEKGSFTGAVQDRQGRFEVADGGTIFLDEVGDIPLPLQVKLLRVLQEHEFERIGSNRTRRVDVRVIAATNRDLEDMLEDGSFREDLFYRLNVIRIVVPPLRDRREDISALAIHFLNKAARETGKPIRGIHPDALQTLRTYDWPGNVRELENVIERAVVLADDEMLTVHDLPAEMTRRVALGTSVETNDGLRDQIAAMELESLRRALKDANGNKSRAAKALGLARSTFISKLKKWDLA